MTWPEFLTSAWGWFVGALTLLLSLLASGHAVLYRRDPRAASMWVAFTWLVPLVGAALYFLLGVNRIRRRAVLLRASHERCSAAFCPVPASPEELRQHLAPVKAGHLSALAAVVEKVTHRPLLPGNHLTPLVNGDAAYPEMLAAIHNARHSLTLSTYIFDRDEAGLEFARALGAAVRRGVAVRVLIDSAGTRYSWPTILGELLREGVRYARFLPALSSGRLISINLRNHRKILVADGRVAFTGGMNIRIGHWLAKKPSHPVQDLHFRVEGPVVGQLQEVFADDWEFTTGEELRGEPWFPPLEGNGPSLARGITDGPDEDFEVLRWTLLGALATAQHSVRILTPYFLPDRSLISALNVAAMQGVTVDIVLPARSNLPFVQWASAAHWWQVLERGCRLWLTPPPFDHSKLFIVDDAWVLVGSSNWDPRSLRLNFEVNLECYDTALAGTLATWFDARRATSRRVTLEEVDARSLPVRLRDGLARLLTPFL
jgi:cardiolipin synthase A/B